MNRELSTYFIWDEILAFGGDKNVGKATHYIFIQAIIMIKYNIQPFYKGHNPIFNF